MPDFCFKEIAQNIQNADEYLHSHRRPRRLIECLRNVNLNQTCNRNLANDLAIRNGPARLSSPYPGLPAHKKCRWLKKEGGNLLRGVPPAAVGYYAAGRLASAKVADRQKTGFKQFP